MAMWRREKIRGWRASASERRRPPQTSTRTSEITNATSCRPSALRGNEDVAIDEVAQATRRLVDSLVTRAEPKDREAKGYANA
jgi:hypothetical protein